jgi:hypothetical protein
VAVTKRAGLISADHSIPRLNRILFADAISTVFGSLTGTSTVTSYVESTAGVEAGGRSGVTAIVTGLLFLGAIGAAPFVGMVPSAATAPALILVGSLMLATIVEIRWTDPLVAVPSFLTLILIPLTYSIANGLGFGIISWAFLHSPPDATASRTGSSTSSPSSSSPASSTSAQVKHLGTWESTTSCTPSIPRSLRNGWESTELGAPGPSHLGTWESTTSGTPSIPRSLRNGWDALGDLGVHNLGYPRSLALGDLGIHNLGYPIHSALFAEWVGVHKIGCPRSLALGDLGVHNLGYPHSALFAEWVGNN